MLTPSRLFGIIIMYEIIVFEETFMSGELLRLRDDDGFTVEYDFLFQNNDGSFLPLNPRRVSNLQRIVILDQDIAENRKKSIR